MRKFLNCMKHTVLQKLTVESSDEIFFDQNVLSKTIHYFGNKYIC